MSNDTIFDDIDYASGVLALRYECGVVTSHVYGNVLQFVDPRLALRMKATPAGAVAIDMFEYECVEPVASELIRFYPSPDDLVNRADEIYRRVLGANSGQHSVRVRDQRVDAAVPAPGSDKRGTK